jgi:hypothetical protein
MEVTEIEVKRKNMESALYPTAQTMMERELERKQKGISEHTMLKIIPEEIREAMREEQLKKGCFRFDKMFRDFYRVGKGIEYSFEKYSFHEVVVGYLVWKKRPGMKRATWSKKPNFYTGFVGPMVWDVHDEHNKFYVVRFSDRDVRRIPVEELEKFLLKNVPLVGLFAELYAILVDNN